MPINEPLRTEILNLHKKDQDRYASTRDGLLGKDFHPDVLQLRRINSERLHVLMRKHGFPGITLVGEEAARAAAKILVVGHERPAIQRRDVDVLIDAEKAGELSPPASPFLIDKIAVYEGRQQIYGTYLDWDEQRRLSPTPVKDEFEVDKRRLSVGLPPLSDYLASERENARIAHLEPPYYSATRRRQIEDVFLRNGWRKRQKQPGHSQSIKHQFASIGALSVPLHKHSAELYHCMKSHGETARLHRLKQLGLIDIVHQGATHSKWDFIVLVMFLIEVAKRHASNLHLSSNIRIGDETLSKCELLKIWILLLGTGHLPWTFSAERELLWLLKNNSTLREDFQNKFKDSRTQRMVRAIFRNEDPYRFHHAIALYRIEEWRTPKTRPGYSDFLAVALRNYINPEIDEYVFRQLVDTFRVIRQLAYFILDLHHIPFLLEFDFRDILINPEKLTRLLDTESHDAKKMLEHIQNYLNEHLYLDRKVSTTQETPMRKLRETLIKDRSAGIDHILKNLLDGEYQRKIDTSVKNFKLVLRLPFRPPRELLAKRIAIRPLSEERKIRKLLGGGKMDLRVWPLPSGAHKNVDFYFPTGVNEAQRLRIEARFAIGVLRYLNSEKAHLEAHFDPSISGDQLKVFRYTISAAVTRFIEHVLRNTMLYPGDLHFKSIEDFEVPMAVACDSKAAAISVVGQAITALGKGRETKGRRHELRALKDAIQRSTGKHFAVLIGNLFIVDEEGARIGEIDGLFISSFYNKLRITFVEAKDQKRRGLKSINDQLERLVYSKLLAKDSIARKFLDAVPMSGTARYRAVQFELAAPKNLWSGYTKAKKA